MLFLLLSFFPSFALSICTRNRFTGLWFCMPLNVYHTNSSNYWINTLIFVCIYMSKLCVRNICNLGCFSFSLFLPLVRLRLSYSVLGLFIYFSFAFGWQISYMCSVWLYLFCIVHFSFSLSLSFCLHPLWINQNWKNIHRKAKCRLNKDFSLVYTFCCLSFTFLPHLQMSNTAVIENSPSLSTLNTDLLAARQSLRFYFMFIYLSYYFILLIMNHKQTE